LKGKKSGSGGKVEILLLQRIQENTWEAMVKPGKSLKTGTTVDITNSNNILFGVARIIDTKDEGIRIVQFDNEDCINKIGEIPLPPYIHTPLGDKERYQTVYAKNDGSVAAPTAGLHFTPELITRIKQKGIIFTPVTLHVGLDTFQPVREDDPRQHIIHRELGTISEETAKQISLAKAERRRVICVGTTATRIVEHAAQKQLPLSAYSDWVDLFILPGYRFLITDAMITNFHLPKTTLLMLVCAFAGKDFIDRAYTEAIKEKYRFYSFGDATMIC
jgi:S-adenosylmethionine:tRNA ribosyltransferase-isomerase